MAFQGVSPFGSLTGGWLSDRIGAPETLVIGGALCVIAGAWFMWELPKLRAVVRPIYIRLGILPEITT
jgi:nitrate/nitrite transporter NarK